MPVLLKDLIDTSADARPDAPALLSRKDSVTYAELHARVRACAGGLAELGLGRDDRVAVYLPKTTEAVVGMLAATAAGGVFVPVNPILKPAQVGHIVRDCEARVLVTSASRAALLDEELAESPSVDCVIVVDGDGETELPAGAPRRVAWQALLEGQDARSPPPRIDADMAAILYTSGSTGHPKGVVLSHRNMMAGAESVAAYLENRPEDRLLAVLPFSFDYGLSQLTTAFYSGASVALMDYLVPRDVIKAVERYGITGLAAVPPLWNQLAQLEWPEAARASLRYVTNSGGAMPLATPRALRAALPETRIFLMYGLTEAFRSTYLPPEEVDERPESMGKAIPNAEVRVVREDGTECEPGEPGELVHRGPLVALGYWNDPARTAERFRPAPGLPDGLPRPEIAVWSGDQVYRDEAGYLYFVGRQDEMIKSSGYRISPTEIEEVAYGHGGMAQAVALGVEHPALGQTIVLVVEATESDVGEESLLTHCRQHLPPFMLPQTIRVRAELPRNANGKIDRRALRDEYRDLFATEADDA